MEWGRYESQLEKRAARTGKLPDALRRKPELFEDLEEVFSAFWMISKERPVHGMGGFGFIADHSIETHIRIHGLPGFLSQREFFYLMHSMDTEYMRIESARSKQRSKK